MEPPTIFDDSQSLESAVDDSEARSATRTRDGKSLKSSATKGVSFSFAHSAVSTVDVVDVVVVRIGNVAVSVVDAFSEVDASVVVAAVSVADATVVVAVNSVADAKDEVVTASSVSALLSALGDAGN